MKTINHECYVSLELSKLLKEAGFDWRTNKFYSVSDSDNSYVFNDNEFPVDWNNNDSVNNMHAQTNETYYSAPTLAVAQRWLREVKERHVIAECEEQISEDNPYATLKYFWSVHNSLEWEYDSHDEIYDTYEEALEAGIKKALEMILEEGE